MSAAELLALSMLMCPPGTPEPYPGVEDAAAMGRAMGAMAERLDLVGPDEHRATVVATEARWQEWVDQWRECRETMARCPPVYDADRLPPAAECAWRRNHLIKTRAWVLRASPFLDPVTEATLTRRLDRLALFWDHAVTAADPGNTLYRRRVALKQIRDLCGEDAYLDADWPAWGL